MSKDDEFVFLGSEAGSKKAAAPSRTDDQPAQQEAPEPQEYVFIGSPEENRQVNKSLTGFKGVTPTQERIASGVAGAYLGSKAAPMLRSAIMTPEERLAAGLRKVQQETEVQRVLRQMLENQVSTRGTPSIGTAPPAPPQPLVPTATTPGAPSTLDVVQHAAANREPTSGMARERGQQFGTKSTFEAGRAQKEMLDKLISRGLVPPSSLDELSLRLGTTVPASGESRVLTTQAGAHEVERARAAERAAEAARAQRIAEIRQRVQQAQQTRAEQERMAQALREASDRAAAARAAEQAAAGRLAGATPGALSRVAGAVARPAMGALTGAGAGLSFYEALQRFKQGDTSGGVIAALGGAGGLASMIPGLGLAGTAVGLGSLPAMYINDVLKGKTEATLPTNVDPMGNPIP